MKCSYPLRALLLCLAPLAVAHAATAPHYRIVQQVSLPGEEGWDYLTFEQGRHRLFIAHGSRVLVVDTDKLAVAGEIDNTPGVHGIALAADLGRGYISAGRANVIVVFDLKTLARLKEIKTTGQGPDAILYDPATHRVFSFNGHGRNATAVDATTDTVVGTIPLPGRPESAAADGKGRVYVDLEDKNSLAVIDPQKLTVTAVFPIAGCDEPAGLALDTARERLFPGCHNQVMAVVDGRSGRVLSTAPIGAGVDAGAYDPGTGLAFASCGGDAGSLVVVRPSRAGVAQVEETVPTQRGARTMALDLTTHRVFLVTADFAPTPPPTEEHPHVRPVMLPGTFRLLVLEPTQRKVEHP
ncbi:MAG: YncE family protein [Steroidobacteraceae bacterium]